VAFFVDSSDREDVNLDYKALRDLPHNKPYRCFVESLWERYEPSGDGNDHFLGDAGIHFRQRFWEMYLYCALQDRGTEVKKTIGRARGGPDYSLEIGGTKFWIEATAPTVGSGSDKVPYPVLGRADYVPETRIKLRYTNALEGKLKCWQEWQTNKIVNEQEGYSQSTA
jgi:hypothetical protein